MESSTTTAGSDLVERARSLRSLIDEHAASGDEQGELAQPVVDALHENRIFGMWVPQSLGGSELHPVASLELIEELTAADASVGWVTMAASLAIGTGAAYLGDEAVEQLFGGDPERFPVIAGQGTRPGKATITDGGFLLSGNWSFASGIKHSGYIHTLAIIEETGEPRIFVLPVGEATLIDNWDVMGLRATGSIDYTIDNVFVPEAYTHIAFSESTERGNLYGLGIIHIAAICHTGWALGVARRMLEELRASAQAKTGRPGQMVDSDSFHGDYARAESSYRAARAFAFETWRDVEATLDRGEPLSVRQKTIVRLAINQVTWAAHDVCLFVYRAGGTSALRAGTIQRYFRDMHAGTQHVIPGEPVLQRCGRELAGLAPNTDWVFLDLVDAG